MFLAVETRQPSQARWVCGNPALFAGFPSAVGTVGKSFWLLDFSTVSTARHFHRALQTLEKKVKG
jgi:hypothetical protein